MPPCYPTEGGDGMSWSFVGLLAALVPWVVVLLSATGVICLS
jgi:hypothetical protein